MNVRLNRRIIHRDNSNAFGNKPFAKIGIILNIWFLLKTTTRRKIKLSTCIMMHLKLHECTTKSKKGYSTIFGNEWINVF